MYSFIRIMNGLLGSALLLAGLFLERMPYELVAQEPGSDSFRLVQFHFVLTGLFSVLVARTSANSRLGVSVIISFLLINLWLGGSALFSGDPSLFWVLVFPFASVSNLTQILLQDKPDSGEAEGEDENLESESDDQNLPPEDFGLVRSPGGNEFLLLILRLLIFIPLIFILPMLLLAYGDILHRVIIDGGEFDFTKLSAAWDGIWRTMAMYVVIYFTVYAAVFGIQYLFQFLTARSDEQAEGDVNRNLSREERIYISESMEVLHDYLENKAYGVLPRVVLIIFVGVSIGLFILFPITAYLLEEYYSKALSLYDFEQFDIIHVNGPAYFGAVIATFLFGVAAGWSLMQYLGGRFRLVGEYLHVKAGWNSLDSSGRTIVEYAKIFARFVRMRRVRLDQKFAPDEFIFNAFRERQGIVYKTTLALALVSALAFVADIKWFQIVHTGGIRYSSYLSLEVIDTDLKSLDRVELRCFLYGDNDDDEKDRAVALKYALVKDGAFSIELDLRENSDDEQNEKLTKIERLDVQIRAAQVPIIKAQRAGIFWLGQPGYAENCAELVSERYDQAASDRMIRVLTPTM